MKSSSLRGLLLACFVPAIIHAQSTWVGGNNGNNFSTAANWSPASVPATNADLIFNTTTNTNVFLNTLPYTADGLTFGSAATNQFFLNGGGGTLTIGAGGVTTNTGNGGVTFNSPMQLALGANQTWTTESTVTVFSNLSGAFSLTKSGSGNLILNGSNSYSGGTTVNAGALYLGSSNNSTGSFTIGSNGTLGTGNSDVTLGSGNAVSLASGATLGGSAPNSGGQNKLELDGTVTIASVSHTLNLGNGAQVFFGGTLTAAAGTALTVHGDGTGLAILTGSQSNVNTMTADNSAIVFANAAALPTLSTNSITATNGGYLSTAAISGGPTPPTVSTLLGMIDRSTFNGTLGFDTPDQSSRPTVFSSNIDLTGFTNGNVRLGSISSAVLTGTITPVAQSYDFGGYAAGSGVLIVQSSLADHGGTTGLSVVSPAPSGSSSQSGLILGLQGTNTFSGNISVSNSSLVLDSAGALPATASISLGANSYAGYTEATGFANFAAFTSRISASTSTSVLGLDSHDALDAYINGGSGTAINTINGTVDLSGFSSIYLGTLTAGTINGTIVAPSDGTVRLANLNKNGALTINSTLTNSNGLVVGLNGSPGTVVINGNNSYAGGTSLLSGGLLAGSNSAFGAGAITASNSNSNNTFLGAATNGIALANDLAVTGQLSIGAGGLDNSGNNFTADTHAITLNGTISGPGQLILTTPTTLTGTNTYSGGTYVEANTNVTSNRGLGTNFVDLGYNAVLTFDTAHPSIGVLADAGSFVGGAGTGSINLTSNVLDLTINQTSSQSFSGQFTGTSANLIKNGSGQLSLLGDNAAHIASTTLNAGNLTIGDGNSTTATFGGNVSAASGTTLIFRPGSGQTMGYSGSITGAGGVTINGTGVSTVNVTGGSSAFTGNTAVNSGTLRINGDNLWSNASAVSVNGSGTLRLDGDQTIENLSGSGTVNIATTGKTLTVNSASATNFSGSINGTGALTKTNTNTLTLTGNNGFTGTLTVAAGTLQLGSGGGSGTLASAVSVSSGATFKINRSGAFTFVNGITGSGGVTTATGTITLTNNNLYTGTTTISSGTLKLGTNGAISNSSQINVTNGATFDVSSVNNGYSLVTGQTIAGTGFVSGAFTAASGSQIAAGAPTGNLTFNSGLNFNTGSILDFNLGSSSSQIVVNSGLLSGPTGTGGITVNLTNSGGFGANTYNLINFNGAALSGFDLTDLTIGTKIAGYDYSFGFNGTTLQLIATTAVPEPSTYAALLALTAAGFALWRRRRQA